MEERRIYRDAAQLAGELRRLLRAPQSVVLANGCFDLLHVGHIRYLEAAAALGTTLVVALNDDRSTARLKGVGRPVVPEEERAEMLLALRVVDYVLIFPEPTVENVLRVLRPGFHAKGTDYTVETVPERDVAREIGCATVIVGDPKGHASRDIIRAIREGG